MFVANEFVEVFELIEKKPGLKTEESAQNVTK